MTDKEIFEKLEAEIERLENYENESVTSSDTRFGWFHGKTFALTSIRILLDSMQKEPKECMYSKDYYTDEDRKSLCEGCEEECKFNKKEEPVSEDLEQEMNKMFPILGHTTSTKLDFYDIARHFANWQKQKDESYTKSMYKVGVNTGKELMKQQLMAKAVDAVVKVDAGGYPYIDRTIELYDYDKDIPLAKKGDKYKVILIKEE